MCDCLQNDGVLEDNVHCVAVHLHQSGRVHHLVAHSEQTEHTIASVSVYQGNVGNIITKLWLKVICR